MREIKFRAWHMLSRYWLADFMHCTINSSMDEVFNRADHIKVMQFTGLKDKNGKEIYEGDIVRAQTYEILTGKNKGTKKREVLQVGYDDAVLLPFHEIVIDNEYWINAFPDVEIIGNIYENTELVK